MKTLQNCLSILPKRNELTEEEHNATKPKNGKHARGHDLPKMHRKNIATFQTLDLLLILQVGLIILL